MPYVYTITPHQKINSRGISSQWEGKHIRFNDEITTAHKTTQKFDSCITETTTTKQEKK